MHCVGFNQIAQAILRTHTLAVFIVAILFCPAPPVLCGAGTAPGAPGTVASKARLGMNLSDPADWNSELPFVDVFRLSRPWISQRSGAPWGKGPELDLDENGWVKRLQPGCWVETMMCSIDNGHYPAGKYTVIYDGRGRLDLWNGVSEVSREPGRIIVEVDPVRARGGFFLKLTETDPKNYVRNIRVIMPGFAGTYAANPWRPAFLRRWRGVACLRFMDWMKTNGSRVRLWADRPLPASATYSEKGIPLELMLDLCNRLGADAWFCMPHAAGDDYVRRFARMAARTLKPPLKMFVEYSNEVWNPMFAQHRYAVARAGELGLGSPGRPRDGSAAFYARRSSEIFEIWRGALENPGRMVRVTAWQAADTRSMENVLLKHADALAIAPYLGMYISGNGTPLNAAEVTGWSVEQVLDHLETESLPSAVGDIRACKKIADRFGLPLIAYEGGQHMIGVKGAENNEALTRLLQSANTHPRIGVIYRKYYDAWTAAGGGLFCYFTSVSNWSKWGTWGILRYYDDDPLQSPKYRATVEWARKCGQALELPEASGPAR